MATKNAIGSNNPIEVGKGGTGNASLTAYAVITGGTTSTAAIQSIASVGTSDQALTSNGAGALPTFQTLSGETFFELLASDPGSPTDGQSWYNTTTNLFKGYDGTVVIVFTVT